MNCLGYYTFAFGKLKLGVRANSSAVEAFTAGNILYRSLQLEPARPSFNHLSANFADADFEFVNNSMTVYDIDHAALVGGSRPLFLKSSVNLAGTASKSQAARIVSVRLREELGGITAEEWKRARNVAFRTTVLALNVEPGMVCSMTHPDMPAGAGEFRVISWRLNKDFSIDISGRTTTDSMYDLVTGPKPADVEASPVTLEPENPVPGDVQADWRRAVQPDAGGGRQDRHALCGVRPARGVRRLRWCHCARRGSGRDRPDRALERLLVQRRLDRAGWQRRAARHVPDQVGAAGERACDLAGVPDAAEPGICGPARAAWGFGESVSRTVDISKATTDGLAAPALPTGITIAEKPDLAAAAHRLTT